MIKNLFKRLRKNILTQVAAMVVATIAFSIIANINEDYKWLLWIPGGYFLILTLVAIIFAFIINPIRDLMGK